MEGGGITRDELTVNHSKTIISDLKKKVSNDIQILEGNNSTNTFLIAKILCSLNLDY